MANAGYDSNDKGVRHTSLRSRKRIDFFPYVYMLPAAITVGVFIVYPLIESFVLSFQSWSGLNSPKYVGLGNYIELLHDPEFGHSLVITVIWVILSGSLITSSGLALALLVEFGVKNRVIVNISRTVLFIPVTISMVAAGLLWTLIYNPLIGLLDRLISLIFGTSITYDFLGNPHSSVLSIFLVAVWQNAGFDMVIFIAALIGIPGDIFDAASIDGASKRQTIQYVVLPLLVPVTVVMATLNVIGAFKAFDLIYVMTQGGPGTATEVTAIYLFKQAFTVHRMGYGSAVAVILLIISFAATYLMTRKQFSRNALRGTDTSR